VDKLNNIKHIREWIPETDTMFSKRGLAPEMPIKSIPRLDGFLWGLHRQEMLVIAARPSNFKCLARGEKVLMHDGSVKKVEEVVVGDKVMGADSKARNVLSVCSGYDKLYRIKQRIGRDYVVNSQHIISLVRTGGTNHSYYKGKRTSTRKTGGELVNIPVEDYIKKSNKFKHQHKGYMVGVEYDHSEVILDPYFLGLWLGDGTSRRPDITTADKEVVDYINSFASK
jgi:replicative DNA helicase